MSVRRAAGAEEIEPNRVRLAIAVRGIVQGVGFRPFVYRLAKRHGLSGSVRNRASHVEIEAQGPKSALEQFLHELRRDAPPLARIDDVTSELRTSSDDADFRIVPSAVEDDAVRIAADVATCADCERELADPTDRRYRHPFINCTSCGPRLTIVTGAPYDRERTTMQPFEMCAACRAEFEAPHDRRFHAQPIACPACGPKLFVLRPNRERIAVSDPIEYVARRILEGAIVAIKGVGGYHLCCDATSERAVSELRRRKLRDEKPFAVMVRNAARAVELCSISDAERALLESAARPIVLVRRKPRVGIAAAVAPNNPLLGVMLAYAPVHHLLLEAVGRPCVMTSGNRSDEPIAYEDDDALERLAEIADVFLLHDRTIVVRCEDSVVRVVSGEPLFLRRSRGYAPLAVELPKALGKPTLAVGGELKNVFALGSGRHAIPSPHLGDLEELSAHRAFTTTIELYERLFELTPLRIVCDLHPDYASTRYAIERAAREQLELVRVQHHHAHMASCLAENGVDGPAIGVSFDGTGYGADGAIWGGEFLVGDARSVERAAHLGYVGLPGGDRAIREPWRAAVAHLVQAGIDPVKTPLGRRRKASELTTIVTMLERRLNSPPTSSVGRLFDAVAALAGLCDVTSFEAQAALELEALASEIPCSEGKSYELLLSNGAPIVVDPAPLVRGVVDDVARGVPTAVIARRFHTTVVELIASVCGAVAKRTGISRVVLSGGVFCNALLSAEAPNRLVENGFEVYRQRSMPPNDGGLYLGELHVVAARDATSGGVACA